MKNSLSKLLALGVTLGLVGAMMVMVNCNPAQEGYDYNFTIKVIPGGEGKCSESFKDFKNNTFMSTAFEQGSPKIPVYFDARTSDGINTWDAPGRFVSHTDEVVEVTPTAPALYLHLVVNAWNDFGHTSKKWKMKKVLDENNVPATDQELDNFTDDHIVFVKGGAAEYFPGEKRSEEEEDIMEGENRDSFYGNYTITGTGANIKINLKPAGEDDQVFEVVESDYNLLKLKATREGITGYLILEPVQ